MGVMIGGTMGWCCPRGRIDSMPPMMMTMVVVVMFVVTEAWLIEHQSKAGAWTADQLAAIGVAWPPAHGWKRQVIGRQISDDARGRFEQALRARQARASTTLDLFK